ALCARRSSTRWRGSTAGRLGACLDGLSARRGRLLGRRAPPLAVRWQRARRFGRRRLLGLRPSPQGHPRLRLHPGPPSPPPLRRRSTPAAARPRRARFAGPARPPRPSFGLLGGRTSPLGTRLDMPLLLPGHTARSLASPHWPLPTSSSR